MLNFGGGTLVSTTGGGVIGNVSPLGGIASVGGGISSGPSIPYTGSPIHRRWTSTRSPDNSMSPFEYQHDRTKNFEVAPTRYQEVWRSRLPQELQDLYTRRDYQASLGLNPNEIEVYQGTPAFENRHTPDEPGGRGWGPHFDFINHAFPGSWVDRGVLNIPSTYSEEEARRVFEGFDPERVTVEMPASIDYNEDSWYGYTPSWVGTDADSNQLFGDPRVVRLPGVNDWVRDRGAGDPSWNPNAAIQDWYAQDQGIYTSQPSWAGGSGGSFSTPPPARRNYLTTQHIINQTRNRDLLELEEGPTHPFLDTPQYGDEFTGGGSNVTPTDGGFWGSDLVPFKEGGLVKRPKSSSYANGGIIAALGSGMDPILPPDPSREIIEGGIGGTRMPVRMQQGAGPRYSPRVENYLRTASWDEADAGWDREKRSILDNFSNGGLVPGGESEGQGDELMMQAMAAVDPMSGMDGQDRAAILAAYEQMYGPGSVDQLRAAMAEQMAMESDGMSDSIPATIDGQEMARISEGEVVIPADAVSSLGNGSTDAGARQLMSMVDELRQLKGGSASQPQAVDARGIMSEMMA